MIAYHPVYVRCAQCGTYGMQPDVMEDAPNVLAPTPRGWAALSFTRPPEARRERWHLTMCPDCSGKLFDSLKFTEQKP